MVDKFSIERALLIGVVREKKWNLLVLNGIDEAYFSPANKPLYRFIKKYADTNTYPDLAVISFDFNIDDQDMSEYCQIKDLQGLCNSLNNEYVCANLEIEVGKLNEYSNTMFSDPLGYINRMGETYDTLKRLSYTSKTVDLFDSIDEILKIDPNDVISTGFAELDKALVGFRRGEELVTIVGRTGQGKSWMGLKFAMAAALKGERVGIYSGEMSKQQLQERSLCCAKQTITSTKEEALQFIKDNKLDVRILTQSELRRRANVNDLEEMIVRDNLTLLVVDQLSLMEDVVIRPGTPIRQIYGNISADLFLLSSKYKLPILLLVQSNRAGGQEQEGPGLESIAESDAVAQNSTRVITMRNENGILTLRVVKNRYGETGLLQKYEVDYGINKYRPIKDFAPPTATNKKVRSSAMFGGTF